ncbi:unnamed protein product, partial [Rotaria sp. Silwood2]
AIIFIFGVIVRYAIGFGLILIDKIDPRSYHIKRYRYTNIYKAVNDLYE